MDLTIYTLGAVIWFDGFIYVFITIIYHLTSPHIIWKATLFLEVFYLILLTSQKIEKILGTISYFQV